MSNLILKSISSAVCDDISKDLTFRTKDMYNFVCVSCYSGTKKNYSSEARHDLFLNNTSEFEFILLCQFAKNPKKLRTTDVTIKLFFYMTLGQLGLIGETVRRIVTAQQKPEQGNQNNWKGFFFWKLFKENFSCSIDLSLPLSFIVLISTV